MRENKIGLKSVAQLLDMKFFILKKKNIEKESSIVYNL